MTTVTTAPKTTASVDRITPDVAAALLGANQGNRHLRPTVVSRYARDMAAGDWLVNGETIKLSTSGRILDGQHRLAAVVESGATIETFVVRDLPDEVQDTVDRGLPRNIADALRLHGETSANVLAGAICQVIVMRSPQPASNALSWPSTPEAVRWLDANPSIRASVHATYSAAMSLRAPHTTFAALHYLFAALDPDDADAFFASLQSGAALVEDSAVFALREVLIREWVVPRRMDRHRLQALCIKAWNAWRKGTPVKQLKWKTGGARPEDFPRPE